jgi:hypothetical protein
MGRRGLTSGLCPGYYSTAYLVTTVALRYGAILL